MRNISHDPPTPWLRAQLTRAVEDGRLGWTLDEVWQKVLSGSWELWTLERPDAQVLVMLEKMGRNLWVVGVAGHGYLRHLEELVTFARSRARELHCTKIYGLVHRAGLAKAYAKIGAAKAYETWALEVEDGRPS